MERLTQLLKYVGHDDVDEKLFQQIQKLCHHWQAHDPAPRRFKFRLKDDREFNSEILVDVVYLSGQETGNWWKVALDLFHVEALPGPIRLAHYRSLIDNWIQSVK